MPRWKKAILVASLVALPLTAACRFIHHTDREYSYWIRLYGENVVWLEERCAELRAPGACDRAEDRRSFLAALESHRASVAAWWWPSVILTALAWLTLVASLIAGARGLLSRRKRA